MSGDLPVVCVHGFGWPAAGLFLVKKRLESEHGLEAQLFSYASIAGSLDENAAALGDYLRDETPGGAHILGHSLGGIVALRALTNDPDSPPGRIVCLGSPLTGSRAARALTSNELSKALLSPSLRQGVISATASEWADEVCRRREVGVIAGTSGVGLGQLVARFDEPNDGTIAVSETRLPGAKAHLCLPVSHVSMLASKEVVAQAAAFFRTGTFLDSDS